MKHPLQRGRFALRAVSVVVGLLVLALLGWYGYVEYRRNYWDEKVREICAKDGGIKVFEHVTLTDKRYVDVDGHIRIPVKPTRPHEYGPLAFEAKPDDLYYQQANTSVIRRGDPSVVRDDVRVFRSSDGKVLGQATHFGRHGGDLVSLEVGSRFRCPGGGEPELIAEIFTASQIKE